MNEEPKSIWKKTLGRKWLGSLMMAVAGSTSIVLVSTLTWGAPAVGLSAEMVYWIVLVLVLWPLITFIRWLCCWRNLKRFWLGTLFVALVSATVIIIIGALSGLFPADAELAVAWLVFVLALWPLIGFIRWLCCWRNLKRALFGLACFATLIALFYAEENWRGKRAWENFKREWEAKGEKFDFKDFVPPPMPDEKNFALTPIMFTTYASVLNRDGTLVPMEQRLINLKDTNFVAQCSRLNFDLGNNDWGTNATGYWLKGTMSNLKLWQDRYRELATKTNLFAVPLQPQSPAADVLLALGKYDSTVEELRLAAQLPECRFPLNYDEENPTAIFLPHLSALKGSSRLLQLRAIAELENNQSEKALADVLLALRLSAFVRTEPTMIGHLVRIAMTDIIVQPIYEGLAEHRWADAQLVALDAELVKLDFLADYNFTMRCERAFSGAIIDYVSTKKRFQRYQELFDARWDEDGNYKKEKKTLQAVGVYLMPSGWFARNKLAIAKIHQQWLLQIAETEKHQVVSQTANEVNPMVANWKSSPCNFFVKELLPGVAYSVHKFTREQISVDLARTAIALERYRLAHGEFPDSLDALAPQFIAQLPHDVIGGGLLKYRRDPPSPSSGAAGGQFVLYSIGWNEKDDGGVTVIPKGSSQPRFEEGDWVWRYPKNQ